MWVVAILARQVQSRLKKNTVLVPRLSLACSVLKVGLLHKIKTWRVVREDRLRSQFLLEGHRQEEPPQTCEVRFTVTKIQISGSLTAL